MDIESYIKDLDLELQEKARACGSIEELLALAKDAKVPLPDEALTAIAGGNDVDHDSCGMDPKCPNCGSKDVTCTGKESSKGNTRFHFVCNKCGTHFHVDFHSS